VFAEIKWSVCDVGVPPSLQHPLGCMFPLSRPTLGYQPFISVKAYLLVIAHLGFWSAAVAWCADFSASTVTKKKSQSGHLWWEGGDVDDIYDSCCGWENGLLRRESMSIVCLVWGKGQRCHRWQQESFVAGKRRGSLTSLPGVRGHRQLPTLWNQLSLVVDNWVFGRPLEDEHRQGVEQCVRETFMWVGKYPLFNSETLREVSLNNLIAFRDINVWKIDLESLSIAWNWLVYSYINA